MIEIVDLGVSNLRSVVRAFAQIGVDVHTTTRAADLRLADGIVLPGVGSFRDGMGRLRELDLVDELRHAALERGAPTLGICLGMQLLADESFEHGRHEGLGIVPGRVVAMEAAHGDRVPNIGWCDLQFERSSALAGSELGGEAAYFVHSYHLECADPGDVVATIEHGGRRVTAAVERTSVMGVQFHPEKSQDNGLTILDAFSRLALQSVTT